MHFLDARQGNNFYKVVHGFWLLRISGVEDFIEEDSILGRNRAVPLRTIDAVKNPLVARLRASSDHSPRSDLAGRLAAILLAYLIHVALTANRIRSQLELARQQ